MVALHSDRMVAEVPPGVQRVLCGHLHSPEVRREGGTVILRPGAAGGTNPWSGPVRAAVVDLELPGYAPLGIRLVEADPRECSVEEVVAPRGIPQGAGSK